MPSTGKRSAAVANATPRSAVRTTLLRCTDRLEYVAQLARIAGSDGRVTHGARYVVDELNELERDLALLRAHVAASPDASL